MKKLKKTEAKIFLGQNLNKFKDQLKKLEFFLN